MEVFLLLKGIWHRLTAMNNIQGKQVLNKMAKDSSLKLDNWSKGLLINLISKAISSDKDITQDDIEKLKEIKKQLQEI